MTILKMKNLHFVSSREMTHFIKILNEKLKKIDFFSKKRQIRMKITSKTFSESISKYPIENRRKSFLMTKKVWKSLIKCKKIDFLLRISFQTEFFSSFFQKNQKITMKTTSKTFSEPISKFFIENRRKKFLMTKKVWKSWNFFSKNGFFLLRISLRTRISRKIRWETIDL